MMSLCSSSVPLRGGVHCPVPVCLVLRTRDGRIYRSCQASWLVYARHSLCSDERPSSRFRGIALPQ